MSIFYFGGGQNSHSWEWKTHSHLLLENESSIPLSQIVVDPTILIPILIPDSILLSKHRQSFRFPNPRNKCTMRVMDVCCM